MPIKRTKTGEPYIDPAKLRSPITFLMQTIVSDTSGKAETWAPASPPDVTRAELYPISGTDSIKAGQDVAQLTLIVTIRYRPPGRNSKERFQDIRGNVYVIQTVQNLDNGRIRYQEMKCLLLGANE